MSRLADPPLRAVTFDFWDTLVSQSSGESRQRRLDAWLEVLEAEGLTVERGRLDAALDVGRTGFDTAWRANQRYSAADSVRDSLAHLGLQLSTSVIDLLVDIINNPPGRRPATTPNVRVALEALAAADVRIGIICDVGLTPSPSLRRYLAEHELLGFFDHWSFSDEVGTFKPDPRIFRHALDGLGGIRPEEAAHVGDLRRTDVAGSQALGIFAVRYAGMYDDRGDEGEGTHQVEGDAVIADHADLVEVLGLV